MKNKNENTKMKNEKNEKFKSFTSKVIFLVLGVYLKTEHITYIINFFLDRSSGFLQLLNHQFYLWEILLYLTILFIVFAAIRMFKNKYSKKKKIEDPKFLNYLSDEFDSKTWKWNYTWNPSTQKYNVINLIPLCDKCNTATILDLEYYDKTATCPRCDYLMYIFKTPDIITAIIIDNIARKLYLEKIK